MNSDISQDTLNNEERITLELLNAVQDNNAVTQRILASHLGVALGLANSHLTRCAKKGLIKISQAPSNRYIYYLTPHGFAEKSRLTAGYLKQSFNFFRIAREQSIWVHSVPLRFYVLAPKPGPQIVAHIGLGYFQIMLKIVQLWSNIYRIVPL